MWTWWRHYVSVRRYTSESSVSLNRSPGQPSSYRSDEGLMAGLDSLRGTAADGWVCSTHPDNTDLNNRKTCSHILLSSIRVSGDPLFKLPLPHKLAILSTMDEVSLHIAFFKLNFKLHFGFVLLNKGIKCIMTIISFTMYTYFIWIFYW